jgi:hypothetical protein
MPVFLSTGRGERIFHWVSEQKYLRTEGGFGLFFMLQTQHTQPVKVYAYHMTRLLLAVLLILTAGCSTMGNVGGSDNPRHIYKVDRKLVTVDGEQHLVTTVEKVPYTP